MRWLLSLLICGVGFYGGALWLSVSERASVAHGDGGARANGWSVLDEDLRTAIRDLGASEWQVREDATDLLIRERGRWLRHLPDELQPETAEARWRWRWIHSRIADLESLAEHLGTRRKDDLRGFVGRLHLELEESLVDALVKIGGHHPEPRIRQRAVELLADLPGIEIAVHAAAFATDASPWVRRSLFEAVCPVHRELGASLVRSALQSDADPIVAEGARALRVHGYREFEDLLRRCWSGAGNRGRVEIGLALAQRPDLRDRAIYFWMLESEDYRLVLSGLRALESIGPGDWSRFCVGALSSPYPEVRERTYRLLQRENHRELALDVLAAVESEDHHDLVQIVGLLVRWQARDFYGEVEALQQGWSESERMVDFKSNDEGELIAVRRSSFDDH